MTSAQNILLKKGLFLLSLGILIAVLRLTNWTDYSSQNYFFILLIQFLFFILFIALIYCIPPQGLKSSLAFILDVLNSIFILVLFILFNLPNYIFIGIMSVLIYLSLVISSIPSTKQKAKNFHLAPINSAGLAKGYIGYNFIAALICFAVFSFSGYFITAFAELNLNNWRFILGVRIFLQFGSALWFCLSLALYFNYFNPYRRKLKILLGLLFGLGLGLVFCFNPILDFLQGPKEFTGYLNMYQRTELMKSTGSNLLFLEIFFSELDSNLIKVNSFGWQANRWESDPCFKEQLKLEVKLLPHLGSKLHMTCP